jgi:hypothetical protein
LTIYRLPIDADDADVKEINNTKTKVIEAKAIE